MSHIEKLQFGILSEKDIKDISVTEVNNTKLSGPNSIYDPLMGTIDPKVLCSSCGENNIDCPGHYGHLNLSYKIIHPMFYKYTLYFLKMFCMKCSRCLLTPEYIKLKNIHMDNENISDVIQHIQNIGICLHCNHPQPKIMYSSSESTIYISNKNDSTGEVCKVNLCETEISHIFSNIIDSDLRMIGINPEHNHPSNLLLTCIPVIPPAARPFIITDNLTCDDDITIQYIDIIKLNKHLMNESLCETKRQKYIQSLKFRVKSLYDNSNEKAKHTNGRPMKGFKKRISGKEGQIRNNLMGKRVNKSARTVIGPDPTLKMNQIAVPYQIANTLSYPVKISQYNYEYLTKLVNSGGANFIIKNGNRINLKYAMFSHQTRLKENDIVIKKNKDKIHITGNNKTSVILELGDSIIRDNVELKDIKYRHKKNIKLRLGDTVERKLQNGDIVLLNRQPTLHKGSMLAHEIVIRPGKTIRMNLANTKTFNADFDGDEMNIHAPSNPKTEAELRFLSASTKNLVSSQSTKPNIVIVQDALLAVYMMTKPGDSISKHDFFNISIQHTNFSTQFVLDRIQHIGNIFTKYNTPNVFSGKGLFSLLCPKTFNFNKGNVHIYRGVLYEGVITKSIINGQNGIIHTLYMDYGEDVCVQFINNVQFVSNGWLLHHGFSIDISDCVATKQQEIQNVTTRCFMEAKAYEEQTIDPFIKEVRVNAALSKARDHGMRIAKEALSPDNNFIQTVTSGSKGDYFNIAQITGLLGQQNFSGGRIQYSLNNETRSLPHYSFGELSKEDEYESHGFIKNSFIHGLNPKEFWFHAITGREGITDTAMKTAQSGYVQRRMVKVGEDIKVANDMTVRGGDNRIIQFQYGGDNLDPVNSVVKNGKRFVCNVDRIADMLNTSLELEKQCI